MIDPSSLILGGNLDLEGIWKWIKNKKKLVLNEETVQRVRNCRTTLERINAKEEPVYGVSTGFGHLENKWISPDKQGQLQINLIRSHAIGTGEEVPKTQVQVAMLLLANSLSQGHSGIKLATLERILTYLNLGITPVTYTIGSLGASGDLAPLAHIALTLIGEGEVYYEAEKYPTDELLDRFDLEPIQLEAKEGLALINGTHFITSYGVCLLERALDLILLSGMASSLSLEALRGTDTPFNMEISQLRPHHGHQEIAGIMRKLLEGSKIIESHKDPRIDHKTQDAYAFRCIPQVMGAVWDAFGYLQKVLEVEINSITDNPLIFPQHDNIYSGGNFHAEPLGFPLETVCMAMIEIANITEARISRLVSPFTPELPAFLAHKPGLESGYMIAHYTAAAIVNKLRGLAHPNITDNIPVSGNQEDHVSMVMTTAVRSWEIMKLTEEIITFELMMAVRGLNMVKHPPTSDILENILNKINTEIDFQASDHIIHNTLEQYQEFIRTGDLQNYLAEKLEFTYSFF